MTRSQIIVYGQKLAPCPRISGHVQVRVPMTALINPRRMREGYGSRSVCLY